jgi:hypothetical protein
MTKKEMKQIPMVDLQAELQLIRKPILEKVTEILDSGKYILGEEGEMLENSIAEYIGVSHALGVGNGTDALQLALKALNINPGDEVITTPFTFFATGEAIAQAGARPVFVDIEEETYNIDPSKIEQAITENTKAIIIVHLFGKAANMQEIMKLAKTHNLWVIEDACQAFGTEYNGKKAGSIGDIGCFSFFPSKNLGAFGDAGLITTDNKNIYKTIKHLRNHGSARKYYHSSIGVNSRLDELQAGMLRVKLNYLDIFLHHRSEIARRYTESFAPASLIKTPPVPERRDHTFHQYCIEVNRRDQLAAALNNHGIASAIYYPIPLHLQEAFHYLHYKKGDFPIAEKVADRILALPISPTMSYRDQDYIISKVKYFLKNNE